MTETPTAPSATILTPELAARGPNVIGATGGSGTRVVARIVQANGMFIGTNRNAYEDALDFAAYSDRWINRFVADSSGRDRLSDGMTDDLCTLVRQHTADLPADAARWGWKEPRSIYLMEFFNERMPTFRFLHFIRDGRDMAFSDNQQQLKKHGSAIFRDGRPSWRRPIRSIALWNRVNLQAADLGERELGSRYLRVRFEDLCAEPGGTVGRIFDFFELKGDAEAIARAEVRPPETLGRWQEEGKRLIAELEREGGAALARFGYRV